MSWSNKVVWSEGMFLKPQHFQQQDRYFERLVRQRIEGIRSYPWGLRKITINHELLQTGKFAVIDCSGVFPDGTPFVVGEDLPPPPPLDLPVGLNSSIVYLCIPVQQPMAPEVEINTGAFRAATRYTAQSYDISDSISGSNLIANLKLSTLQLRFMTETEDRSAYHCLGIAKVREVTSDKRVILEPSFIPPLLSSNESTVLKGYISEVLSMLKHRGDALAQRVSGAGQGVAEIADFLLLQIVNKSEPLFLHMNGLPFLHPESLYAAMLELAGELATFTSTNKRAEEYPTYLHDDLQTVFAAVMLSIRRSLSAVIEQSAIEIPLQKRKYGVFVGEIIDKTLLKNSAFILIVKAATPEENIRRSIPPLIKIGSVEQIRALVNVQLPGVTVRPLPTAPRQLPFYSGGVYFELDTTGAAWKALQDTGALAVHLSGEFPELSMDLWAIRQR